jgi:hypothetical protein
MNDFPEPMPNLKEIKLGLPGRDPCAILPTSLRASGDFLIVADAETHEIKIFSLEGRLLRSIGKRGSRPGEFCSPQGVDAFRGRIYVADTLNRRIQILDEKGSPVAGFSVPFYPARICVFGEDRIAIAILPLRLKEGEKIVRCFDSNGHPSWEAVDSLHSGNEIYDTLQNQVFLEAGRGDSLWVIRRFNGAVLTRLNDKGRALEEVDVRSLMPQLKVAVPLSKAERKELTCFCWTSGSGGGKLCLLHPEETKERDLIGGRKLTLLDDMSRSPATALLPVQLKFFSVSGSRIYGIDRENFLRVFELERK